MHCIKLKMYVILFFIISAQSTFSSQETTESVFRYVAALTGKDRSGRKRLERPSSFIGIKIVRDEDNIKVDYNKIIHIHKEDENWLYIPYPIQFALPRNLSITEWEYKGGKYIDHGERIIELLGVTFIVREISLGFVECKDVEQCDPSVFYFSDEHGLIGFKKSDPIAGIQRAFWTTGKHGISFREVGIK